MTLNLELPPRTQRTLEDLASTKAQPVDAYLHDMIERTVKSERAIDVIVGPFCKGFEESGMTEEELGLLVNSVVKEVRADRRAERQRS